MQLTRVFHTTKYKGSRNYINSQKKYEILRTVILFGISISLFIAGWVMVGSRVNVLTIIAILGCLPASKSAVSMILFLRYGSCSESAANEIEKYLSGMEPKYSLYDLVFTSYQKNYAVAHLIVRGKTMCGYTEDIKFMEQDFYRHMGGILKTGGYSDVTIKIFTDLKKYGNRLEQLKALENNENETEHLLAILKSVTL